MISSLLKIVNIIKRNKNVFNGLAGEDEKDMK